MPWNRPDLSPTARAAVLAERPDRGPAPVWSAVGVSAALLAILAVWAAGEAGERMAWVMLIAAALGFTLYHGSLGFTAHWRKFILVDDARGVRLQLIVIAVSSLGFFPLIGGMVEGFNAPGAIAPLGLEVFIGAFIFGVGMQLANGCGSGTLFTLGGGSTKMVLTLIAFIAGSLVATFHLELWRELPRLPAVSLVRDVGLPAAAVIQAVFVGGATWWLTRRLKPGTGPRGAGRLSLQKLLKGPWQPEVAAVVLGVLAILVFYVSSQTWSVTFAFALWGGKIFEALGGDLSTTAFWSAGWARAALDESVFRNATSVMDFGVILGAMLAAGLAGKFRPPLTVPLRPAIAALIGGLLLGYGARLAFGCNIGAFISGTASGSLHGWLWMAAAFLGSMAAVRLRPAFGLQNP